MCFEILSPGFSQDKNDDWIKLLPIIYQSKEKIYRIIWMTEI